MGKDSQSYSIPVLINFYRSKVRVTYLMEILQKVKPSKLYLFQDGPKNEQDNELLNENLNYVRSLINWPCDVKTKRCHENYGPAVSEVVALRWLFSKEEYGIFSEDDHRPSLDFFVFCQYLLEKYRFDNRVAYVSGVNPRGVYGPQDLDYFFSVRGTLSCFATWKRFVDLFDDSYSWLFSADYQTKITRGLADRHEMKIFLKHVREKAPTHTPDIELLPFSTAIMNGMFAIVPSKNLVMNCGADPSAQNGATSLKLMPRKTRKLLFAKTYTISYPPKGPLEIQEMKGYISFFHTTFLGRFFRKTSSVVRKIVYSKKR